MTDSLGSVLDETISNEPDQQEVLADDAATHDDELAVNDSGEQEANTPTPEVVQEDKKQRGIESALLAERRKRQEAEAELERYRSTLNQQTAQQQQEPDVSEFETYEQYISALSRFHADQRFGQLKAEEVQRHEQVLQQRVADEFSAQAETVINAGRAKYSDFDQVINERVAPYLTPAMQQALVYSANGHEVSYYLGNNPDVLHRIAELHPALMMREIFNLEASLAKPTPAPTAKPVIPKTLTDTRDARGRFESNSDGPTPLDAILGRKT
jgi:hypothetical protein